MPTTYPDQGPTINGQRITVDRLMNNPVLIYRMLRTLVEQRLVGDKILSGRVDLTGSGSAIFETGESIYSDRLAERVGDMGEYPLTGDTAGPITQVKTEKWALATEFPDTLVSRNRMDIVSRKLIKLANRLAKQFDETVLSAVASAVTQTQAASAAWNTAGADPFLDALLSGAVIDELNEGFEVDMILARPTQFARLLAAAKILDRLPREGEAPVLTGRIQKIAGFTIVKTTNMPPSTTVMCLDSTQLGSIAFEDQGGGYTGSADGVQTKKFRLEHADGQRLQARKVGVPMVQEPNAAIKVTGV
ncbi:hypothetical protein CH278_02090 [Rhodococcus sp. 05-2254-5]|jgi:hypothetical protein|uniref:phage major capsid protein n=1 Tax=unclassified Rhodococcus (in: high G+C Gram-positive bacteria) TaxID=192944 RepID=UPI000B9C6EB0|nr:MULTISPECIES: hypothetical protein [unclassified Rhodococcus (in: high G+C Gram-positive bacteria)]OZE39095.1 hypothetical protein CH278_02090 [Rhodococcus sp. 05-2254-5]OZE59036.1 hypothetical protein CH269_08585 [Rhodococcus sp. 05-2254-1]